MTVYVLAPGEQVPDSDLEFIEAYLGAHIPAYGLRAGDWLSLGEEGKARHWTVLRVQRCGLPERAEQALLVVVTESSGPVP